MNIMNFIYEMPIILSYGGMGNPEAEVGYYPYEGFTTYRVSVHHDMEIPVGTYRQVMDHRSTLEDFYSRGHFPFRWGPGSFNSRVENPTCSDFDEMLRELMLFPNEAYTRSFLPNISEAISWPLGYPCSKFIQLSNEQKSQLTLRSWKSAAATCILRMNPWVSTFDQAFVEAHKMILKEATNRGLSRMLFPGYDLIKEVAIVQLVRAMNALDIDMTYSRIPTVLTNMLEKHKNVFENENPDLLGNRKWIPSDDTWFEVLNYHGESEFDTSSDSDAA
ncbi:NSs [Icoaraci virus]|uniref:NSs n=2 Tax=Phlebovirus TaxID=11584 RepID=A0A4P8D7U7_9VIRU|nr:NSs [Icoaraci virus]ABQ23523.1 nonstructural protein [Phlebovirus sp. Be An 24262]QCI62748.1 NSs [Icoaraci virus]